MCRIAAYTGPEIPLKNIITAPEHSLLSQSRDATESKVNLNGDGFGIAWYGYSPQPGLYRECLPAWSDENLLNLSRMVQSHLFIAHVRASTIGETMRANCHPFAFENWSFAHNGQIGGYPQMQRDLEIQLSDQHYHARRGTTDSELLFLLLLQYGLSENPAIACSKVISLLEDIRREKRVSAPLRLAFVFSDGIALYGVRYASDDYCPTLYQSKRLDNNGISLSSEPLDGNPSNWTMLAPSTMAEVKGDQIIVHQI